MYIPRVAALCVLAMLCAPAAAGAQALAIGPRMTFVRADPALETPNDRYTGGALRLRTSPRTAIELAMDWRSTTSDDATVRIRDYPFQGSLLVYPIRAAISPYALGGVGWYSQRMEAMSGADVVSQQTVRRMGYHGGFGGELKLGRRASLFADYRYTFISFDGDEDDEGAGGGNGAGAFGFPIPGATSLMDNFRLSHEGAMWTGGLVINF